MLEVENKYRCPDPAAVRRALLALGAAPEPPHLDRDRYFAAPDRDFAQTDEAVRVRSSGEANVLTYKGPKRRAATKTRTEVEVPLAPGPEAAGLAVRWLSELRYRPVAVVEKVREPFTLSRAGVPLTVCLDEVAGVGHFAEVEAVAAEADFAAAEAAVLALAEALGLTDVERRSYLALTLARGAA